MHSAQLSEPHHPSIAPELLRLRRENEFLREAYRQLMEELGANPELQFIRRCRAVFGLQPSRAKMLAVLVAGKVRDKDSLLLAYSGNRRDMPEIRIVDTLVRYLRIALAPHGVSIETEWGVGYYIAREGRERLNALLDGADV